MPPKKEAISKKIIEDKTFGLKNKKKSKKVQAFVAEVSKQAKRNVDNMFDKAKSDDAKRQAELRKAKEAQAAIEKEMSALLRASVKQPKLEPGVDPKSVLCEFFKAGCCEKGDKCKFSHDLTVGRKAAKIDLYTDRRAEGEDKKDETNADWDQEKLEEVVSKKLAAEGTSGSSGPAAGAGAGVPTKTDIVCRYFLDAIEKEIYGWFWKCPNGDTACKYKHALPAGYTYRSKKQRDAEAAAKLAEVDNAVSMEELIEEERKKLPTEGLTPVTAESFAKWKEARAARRAVELEARRVEEAKRTGTKGYNVLSGRALFAYDPSLFIDDDAAGDAAVYEEREEEPASSSGSAADGAPAGGAGGDAAAGAGGVIDESLFAGDDADLDDLPEEDDEDGEEEGEEGEEEEEEAAEGGAGAP